MKSEPRLTLMRTDSTVLLTFDDPGTLNAIDPGLLLELERNLQELESDRTVRVLILTGRGKAFVAGANIGHMRDLPASEGRPFVELGHRVLDRLSQSRLISIAAINGFALGGGAEIALACDIRVAATAAKIGFPEVRLGLFPAWGGTQRLIRLIGPSRARLLIFTGDLITASEAMHLGLVDRVVPGDDLLNQCNQVANRISEAAPRALEQAKVSLVQGGGQPIDIGNRIEIEAWLVNFGTHDRVEGLTAFLDKRPPVWLDE